MRVSIPVEKVRMLQVHHRATITDDYLDAMGHMNVRWYLALFDTASWDFFARAGMTIDYYRENQAGGFALRHVISYLAEVRAGETVTLHGRMLARNARRIHFMMFMVNDTTDTLAATLEVLGSHADMRTRRTAPYPDDIAARLDTILAQHQALDWDVPLSGAISL